jgi:hypothetical protein
MSISSTFVPHPQGDDGGQRPLLISCDIAARLEAAPFQNVIA